jgi:hypothetical protein
VDILPSTRKRISSGCAGNGRTLATLFRTFDRDVRGEVFPVVRVRVVFSARRDVALRACDLGLRADFRREDLAVFGARGFCGDRRVARLLDFGLRSRGGIRLYLLRGPSVAASVSERIEDPAVEAAQNVAH